MLHSLGQRLLSSFAPPRYLAPPLAGIDLSSSGIKTVRLAKGEYGLTLVGHAETSLPPGAFVNGEVVDRAVVVNGLKTSVATAQVKTVNVALSESASYIFETEVSGGTKDQQYINVEQRLEELVPLPPSMTAFDFVDVGKTDKNETRVVGTGFAQRVVDDVLSLFDEASITVRALEAENFAVARALLPFNDESTVLIIDLGKTTTKISIVSKRVPRFTTTIGIGGHALTVAVQKYFGVTETEAKKVKVERGIVPMLGNEEYIAAMLSTVSAIRDEISNRLDYWQSKVTPGGAYEPVSRAILAGGNASIRGLQEYLENELHVPVVAGDVFTNFAPRDKWLPPIDHSESLAYATAIGLALYDT